MTLRKKKLVIIQISLLILGSFIIFFTYVGKKNISEEKIISEETQKKIEKQISTQTDGDDVFFNIEYSGLDLTGNRYILRAEKAQNSKNDQEKVNMSKVEATFYFKDDTILYVWSESGVYNNKTLDMKFQGNVRANYLESRLFAQKAEFSNSKSFLIISENVKIQDIRGTMLADKLFFDIKKQKLNIASFNDGKINANINLK